MKSFIAIITLSIFSTACYSQQQSDNIASNAAQPKATQVVSEKNSVDMKAVMVKLSPLQLSAVQKKNVSAAIQKYMDDQPNGHTATLRSHISGRNAFMEKMKSSLSPQQYDQFMKMKPAEGDSENPLSKLFD